MQKLYTNEVEWQKTAKVRRGLGIFAGLALVLALVGFILILSGVPHAEYLMVGGFVLYLLHIPIREFIKKKVGWRG